MSRRYPLQVLKTLRKEALDARTRDLADRIGEREARERDQARARAAQRVEAEARAGVHGTERELLEGGELRAADLTRAATFELGASERAARLADIEARAARSTGDARDAEDEARGAVVLADAETRAVERHQQAWHAERARERERAAQDDAEDAWNARRGGG